MPGDLLAERRKNKHVREEDLEKEAGWEARLQIQAAVGQARDRGGVNVGKNTKIKIVYFNTPGNSGSTRPEKGAGAEPQSSRESLSFRQKGDHPSPDLRGGGSRLFGLGITKIEGKTVESSPTFIA